MPITSDGQILDLSNGRLDNDRRAMVRFGEIDRRSFNERRNERMNTVKMTRAQLRVAIGEKRDDRTTGDYLRDMNEAIVLLRELPDASLDYQDEKPCVVWWDGIEIYAVNFEIGNEAEAIACAWWQFTTGEIVEICE